jgi:DNA-binding protein H-NS
MAKTYTQMMEEIEALKREAERVRQQEIEGVIARIKEAVAFYGLTAQDLGLGGARRGRPPGSGATRKTSGRTAGKSTAAAKYRDDRGNTWSGRGPRPKWFKDALAAGRRPEDLAA